MLELVTIFRKKYILDVFISLHVRQFESTGCDSCQNQTSLWLTQGNLPAFCGSHYLLAGTFWLVGLHISWHPKWLFFRQKPSTWNSLKSPWFSFILVIPMKKCRQCMTATLSRFLTTQSRCLLKQTLPCAAVYAVGSYTAIYTVGHSLKIRNRSKMKIKMFETLCYCCNCKLVKPSFIKFTDLKKKFPFCI